MMNLASWQGRMVVGCWLFACLQDTWLYLVVLACCTSGTHQEPKQDLLCLASYTGCCG
jgi:hypothetical protein